MDKDTKKSLDDYTEQTKKELQKWAEEYAARPLTDEERKGIETCKDLIEEELKKYEVEKKQKQWGLKLDEPRKESTTHNIVINFSGHIVGPNDSVLLTYDGDDYGESTHEELRHHLSQAGIDPKRVVVVFNAKATVVKPDIGFECWSESVIDANSAIETNKSINPVGFSRCNTWDEGFTPPSPPIDWSEPTPEAVCKAIQEQVVSSRPCSYCKGVGTLPKVCGSGGLPMSYPVCPICGGKGSR